MRTSRVEVGVGDAKTKQCAFVIDASRRWLIELGSWGVTLSSYSISLWFISTSLDEAETARRLGLLMSIMYRAKHARDCPVVCAMLPASASAA